MRKWLVPGLLGGVLLASGAVRAHGLYVAERHGGLAAVIGFSSNDDAYALEKLSASAGYDVDGKPVPAAIIRHDSYVEIKPGPGTATLVTTADYGYYSKIAGGRWKEVRKRQLPGAVQGLHALKYNIFVMAPGSAVGKAHGIGIEIVPLEDPLAKQRGDSLPVRLLIDGKPAAGQRLVEDFVGDDSLLSAPTDADGRTVVTLRASRLNVIGLEADAPVSGDPDTDFNRYYVTLSFELNHKEPD